MNKVKEKTPSGESVSIEPIVQQQNTIVNFNIETLMMKAVENGLSPETMEKFLAMRQQLKAEWAKEQYNKAMAGFQSECPTIQKTKEVKNDIGKTLYSYAPIESVVSQVKEYLQKYGFSYSTSMEVLPDGVKVCVKTIHIDGHSEESCMQVPLGTKTGIMSASQQTAAAQTFAKRYAFLNAFGILTGDEDNDGAEIPTKPVYAQPKTTVQKAQPTNELSEKGKLFKKDLEGCNTIEEFQKIKGELSFARNTGKLSSYDLQVLKDVFSKTESEIMPQEDLPVTEVKPEKPGEAWIQRGKEAREAKQMNPAEVVEQYQANK